MHRNLVAVDFCDDLARNLLDEASAITTENIITG
jgi:hypothetical protein